MNNKFVNYIAVTIVAALITITVLIIAVPLAKAGNMFVVSFVSFGAGIDRDTALEFENFLSTKYPDIRYEVNPAGYEGEFDYCFDLSDLSEEQQTAFQKESIEILQKSKLVEISEQDNCPKKL
ncbi:MAG: hypothetical protein F6K40_26495 [Okeania sp. SIO3I5]|uniref:hypothetical protein n=1 Tax=Okeania sp. SIO3I5 TaxID=2607805 RepID=UPI0013B77119|nr:hypothetical protein [Okeania sp. SIO3I5]NEQ39611.1 hypothetical protein [Okeania sp. SIO3I5]